MSDPQQIGKYHVVGVAGRGNMATVFVGHDPFSDTHVAIKVCPVTAGSGFKIARKLFLNEAHTAGSLDHPNILSVLDAGEQDGRPYIVPVPVAKLRADAPRGLAVIIAKAMAKQLTRRYEYAHEMAAAGHTTNVC